MKKVSSLAIVIMFALSFWTCGGGSKSCKENCDSDGDCKSGLSCFKASGYSHKICLPDECQSCFSAGETCYYNSNQDDDGNLSCEFTSCN